MTFAVRNSCPVANLAAKMWTRKHVRLVAGNLNSILARIRGLTTTHRLPTWHYIALPENTSQLLFFIENKKIKSCALFRLFSFIITVFILLHTFTHVGISTQLCELLPSNLLSGSTPPLSLPCPVWDKYTVWTYTVCKGVGRGMGFLASDR